MVDNALANLICIQQQYNTSQDNFKLLNDERIAPPILLLNYYLSKVLIWWLHWCSWKKKNQG